MGNIVVFFTGKIDLKPFEINITMNKSPIFEFYPAKNQSIGLISIPHSGEEIPQEFTGFLCEDRITKMQDLDFRVHELIDIGQLQEAGISVLKSNISRICVDLNRSQDKCLLTWEKNSQGRTVVTNTPSDKAQKDELIASYYTPYYEFLKASLLELDKHLKQVNFVDLHSMPSKATEYHLNINPDQKIHRPDFCISDQSGTTCKPSFINSITQGLSVEYANVTQNDPYFGGHITVFANELLPDCNNIQIEISRALYMNEAKVELINHKVEKLRAVLTEQLLQLFNKFKA